MREGSRSLCPRTYSAGAGAAPRAAWVGAQIPGTTLSPGLREKLPVFLVPQQSRGGGEHATSLLCFFFFKIFFK